MSGFETAGNVEIGDVAEEYEAKDECGVFGVYGPDYPVGTMVYYGIKGLQHRGESGAGIMVYDDELGFWGHKGTGLVDDAIPEAKPDESGVNLMDTISSSGIAIGHVRYSTAASNAAEAAQPFNGNYISLSMNGHIEGLDEVARKYNLDTSDGITDTHKLTTILDARTAVWGDTVTALKEVLPDVNGAYCLTISDGQRLIGVRDPWGFHPLALGEMDGGPGYVIASEPVVLGTVGAALLRDIEPGEIVIAGPDGIETTRIGRDEEPRRCAYEFMYTSRVDGEIDGVPVHSFRSRLGEFLAQDHPAEADAVVALPASGTAAGFAYASKSGLPLVDGVVKNVYTGRSFLQRGTDRATTLGDKARIIESVVAGKDLVVVDDSAIKGNSLRANVKLLRAAGVGKIHIRIASAPYIAPCYMGMDTGNPEELVARKMSVEDMAEYFDVDSIAFLSPERIQQAAEELSAEYQRDLGRLCMACSTGEYPFPIPSQANGQVKLGMPEFGHRPDLKKYAGMPIAG